MGGGRRWCWTCEGEADGRRRDAHLRRALRGAEECPAGDARPGAHRRRRRADRADRARPEHRAAPQRGHAPGNLGAGGRHARHARGLRLPGGRRGGDAGSGRRHLPGRHRLRHQLRRPAARLEADPRGGVRSPGRLRPRAEPEHPHRLRTARTAVPHRRGAGPGAGGRAASTSSERWGSASRRTWSASSPGAAFPAPTRARCPPGPRNGGETSSGRSEEATTSSRCRRWRPSSTPRRRARSGSSRAS